MSRTDTTLHWCTSQKMGWTIATVPSSP
uniref:BGL34 n=1 Tax=Arundo donax TaxID=35708 RepID=A0A0A8ZAW4_ARUDO